MSADITRSTQRPRGADTRPPNHLGVAGAVVAAGAVPAIWNLALLNGVEHSSTFLVVYFLLGVVPLGLGFLSAGLRRHPHVVATVLLGATAACVEAVIEAVLLTNVGDGSLVLAGEDAVSWVATALLFVAGALFGQRRMEKGAGTGRRSADETKALDILKVTVTVLGLILNVYQAFAGQ
jgi:hypothetical protein